MYEQSAKAAGNYPQDQPAPNTICQPAPNTICQNVGALNQRLAEAIERVYKIVDRVVGPRPEKDPANTLKAVPHGLDNAVGDSLNLAERLHSELNHLENRI